MTKNNIFIVIEIKRNKMNFAAVNIVNNKPYIIESRRIISKNLLNDNFEVRNIENASLVLNQMIKDFEKSFGYKVTRVMVNLPNFKQETSEVFSTLTISKNNPVDIEKGHFKEIRKINTKKVEGKELFIVNRNSKQVFVDNNSVSMKQIKNTYNTAKEIGLIERIVTIPKTVRDSHISVPEKLGIKAFVKQTTSTFGMSDLLMMSNKELLEGRIYSLVNWKKDFIEVSIFENKNLKKTKILNYGIYDLINKISPDEKVQENIKKQIFELLNFSDSFHNIDLFNSFGQNKKSKIVLSESFVKEEFKFQISKTWLEIYAFLAEENVPKESAIFNFGIIREIAGFESLLRKDILRTNVIFNTRFLRGKKISPSILPSIGTIMNYHAINANNTKTFKTSIGETVFQRSQHTISKAINQSWNMAPKLTSKLFENVQAKFGMGKKVQTTLIANEEFKA